MTLGLISLALLASAIHDMNVPPLPHAQPLSKSLGCVFPSPGGALHFLPHLTTNRAFANTALSVLHSYPCCRRHYSTFSALAWICFAPSGMDGVGRCPGAGRCDSLDCASRSVGYNEDWNCLSAWSQESVSDQTVPRILLCVFLRKKSDWSLIQRNLPSIEG